jgi:hypothetical protein
MTSKEAAHQQEQWGGPSAEALLASVLALMTGHAQASGDDDRIEAARHVELWLRELAQHPGFSDLFRAAVGSLVRHWERVAEPPGAEAPAAQRPVHGQRAPQFLH